MIARSWLFVPGDDERKLNKVAASRADAIIIDLEDAVAASRKDDARSLTAALLRDATARHCETWVRVNSIETPWFKEDLASIADAAPVGIVLPKVNSATELQAVDRRLHELSNKTVSLLPLTTETARGVLALPTYAGLPASVAALTWGAEDLAADVGAAANRNANGDWLAPFELARSLCLLAAAANGLPAIDTVYTDFRNTDGLAAYASGARRLGFAGMLAIHPAQIEVIHAAFTPSVDEITHAQAVLAAFDGAAAGVASLDGRMLDEPHRRQAEQILALAQRT
ncbi:MAG: CoA ester lyase [Pseudomonadota bacterium]